jgi:hypothetical protein
MASIPETGLNFPQKEILSRVPIMAGWLMKIYFEVEDAQPIRDASCD